MLGYVCLNKIYVCMWKVFPLSFQHMTLQNSFVLCHT